MIDVATVKRLFDILYPVLNERDRRLVVGAGAMAIGYGGVSEISRATSVCRETIANGVRELREPQVLPEGRVRRKGGGRKRTVLSDLTLKSDLETLIDPVTRGHPESPLRWTCKSVRKLASELRAMGHRTSHRMVAELLHEMRYSLQANRKTIEGSKHPDRNAQFEYISGRVQEYLSSQQPAISVDTKKKELVGNFKNSGKELCSTGAPEEVFVHDFPIPGNGKVAPYGVYDMGQNAGWVSVGTDHDTATFAVETIRRWWYSMGREVYPTAKHLLITADSGGSNGSRVRLWKVELQNLADETGMSITVSHLPPGTSKWNKIEHRLFSFITQNWRGKPLVSHEVIVNLIASTQTRKGLSVRAELDTGSYPKGVKIPDKQLAQISINRHAFHGDWNYTISPRSP